MKQTLLIVLSILILSSCKESLKRFLFDNSKVLTSTKYSYEYNSGKKVSMIEKSVTFYKGRAVDSMILATSFRYNEKGLLKAELQKSDYEENPTQTIYDYNLTDSLSQKMTISSNGDTTFWEKYEYFNGIRKTVYQRILSKRPDPHKSLEEFLSDLSFDTICYRNEYEFMNGVCIIQNQYDKNNKLKGQFYFKYKDGLIAKEIHYELYDTVKMIAAIKFYDYSKSKINPDYYLLNQLNDTISKTICEIEDDQLVKTTEKCSPFLIESYFENGKRCGDISYHPLNGEKELNAYTYNEYGDIEEWKTYREKINAR